ncbi:PLP-dependent transferase [Phanerochaete sordida]|uniref:PLP-dependent transferase n=1 Tax=Phanerochaete sordida TaxID=48140 RepID=A0A9P3G4T3_9APHY|nr:PLP-dependent transferase [Phanerochaete sordida]
MEPSPVDPVRLSRGARLLSLVTLGCVRGAPADVDSNTVVGCGDEKGTSEQAPPSCKTDVSDPARSAYTLFLKQFPEYSTTATLDELRQREYRRLDQTGETYVDYMGGSLYPESLVDLHMELLRRKVLGNTHSINPSAQLSSQYAAGARQAILEFFDAPPGYTVIFTANASAALKLIGEAFPFSPHNCLVLGADSHNSVHGIRQFATQAGARVQYVPTTQQGGLDESIAQATLYSNCPDKPTGSLFVLTGQSNVTNSKVPLALIAAAAAMGYSTLLDAAALAPTSRISLAENPVDAMAVSFYKMFGYPTGIGALIAKNSFLLRLRRPWFAGGTVEFVQSPGTLHFASENVHERFEDGTINYLGLPAVTEGLRLLSRYLPYLPLRLSILAQHLVTSLEKLRHESTGTALVRVLSKAPRATRSVGEPAEAGTVVSLIFLSPNGDILPLAFVEHAATQQKISLRTGCMCNSGGTLAMRGLQDEMAALTEDTSVDVFRARIGRDVGVVRVSLGLASNFQDIYRVLQFAQMLAVTVTRETLWSRWKVAQTCTQT